MAREILCGCWDGDRENAEKAWDEDSWEIDKTPYLKEATIYVNIMKSKGYVKMVEQKLPKPPKTGVELISAERERQMSQEGWTAQHDDKHPDYDLASVGALYALNLLLTKQENYSMFFDKIFSHFYPWDEMYWKPTPDNPIRQLTKAGALIAAEIDRLQRKCSQ